MVYNKRILDDCLYEENPRKIVCTKWILLICWYKDPQNSFTEEGSSKVVCTKMILMNLV